jgi:hypothetical protein
MRDTPVFSKIVFEEDPSRVEVELAKLLVLLSHLTIRLRSRSRSRLIRIRVCRAQLALSSILGVGRLSWPALPCPALALTLALE